MHNIKRIISLDLAPQQSAFLWGARKTGKSTYLRMKYPTSLFYDFLKTDIYFGFSKRPSLLREQLLAKKALDLKSPIILDEVQKIPKILDEVHWLIENKGLRFIMCGSSARKLKRGQANLLGGRAWRYELFPLVSQEIPKVDLLRALNHGMIPIHYLQDQYQKSLKAYVQDYLKEEVFAEGLARNIPAFSRFFDAMGYSHGELINFSNIARECGVDSKTVKEYFHILVDTLLGTLISPFQKKQNRQVITKAPKFYLFDVGVAGMITQRRLNQERGIEFGKAFEHFIFMELSTYRSYTDQDFSICFWRTKSGLEVDFILGYGEVAIEVKGSDHVNNNDLKSLKAFMDEYSPKKVYIVCNEDEERVCQHIKIMPWRRFLNDLWDGKVL